MSQPPYIHPESASAPGTKWVTLAADTDYSAARYKGIRCDTGGTLVIEYHDGTQTTFSNLGDGAFIPGQFAQIIGTGTTASGFQGEL